MERMVKTWRSVDFLVFFLYLLAAAWGINNHEMWLDELQHWCLARDSHSLGELLGNTNAEGHPIAWHLILYAITRFTSNPEAMQLVHYLIGVSAMGILFFASLLPRSVRYLSLFGYFTVYEYVAISRNYALGMLLLFLVLSLWKERQKRSLLLLLLLALMAQVHLWAMTVALVLFVVLIFERRKEIDTKTIVGGLIVLVSVVGALAHMLPTADSPYAIQWDGLFSLDRINAALGAITQGLLPLPNAELPNWWNSNVLYGLPWLPALLGLLLFVLILRGLKGQRTAQFIFVVGTLGVLAFPYLMLYKGVRYHGPIFLLLLSAVWLISQEGKPLSKALKIPLLGILIVQLIGGLTALTLEATTVFSNAERTVEHIKAHYPNLPVVVSQYSAGPSISAYLEAPVFYPNKMEFGSYCDWLQEPFQLNAEETMQRLDEMPFEEFIFLSPAEFPETPEDFVLDTAFGGSVVGFEDYHIYTKE